MEKKLERLSLLSSEEIIKEFYSNKKSDFIKELSKQKKISKEMNRQLVQIFEKIKMVNDEKGNIILCDILSDNKITKMLKAFPSKELTDLFNFVKKYKKRSEKNVQKNSSINKEDNTIKIINEKKIEEKFSINYKFIDISIESLLTQNIPFDFKEIENIPNNFRDNDSFIDYYFKKEYYDNYKNILDIFNIMNNNENGQSNSDYPIYNDILITNLEVRCYGIFLTVEFEKIEDIENKFKHENLLIISSMDSSYIFITEIYLNPYRTHDYYQLKYFNPPIKDNYQKIKVKLINVEVLKKICFISNDIKLQMFEYENELSLSKVSLKTLQDLDITKFTIPGNYNRIFSFEEEKHNLKDILEQVKDKYSDSRKIYNIFLNNHKQIAFKGKIAFKDFIDNLTKIIEYPLLIVSRNNKSIDNILFYISNNLKNLEIKKIVGHFSNKINKNLCYNYHLLGFENKDLEEKIRYEWHNLKRSLSENRVNSRTIKFCQKYYNFIIDDFYEISKLKRTDNNMVKSQIVECFLNERNLKSFIQSQIRDNPEEILLKFSPFVNIVDRDYKIKYLWENNYYKYTVSTNEWKDNNLSYWIEQSEENFEINEEEETDNEEELLFENQTSEELSNKVDKDIDNISNKIIEEKINENEKKNEIIEYSFKKKNNKINTRKNYWLLNEEERRELIKTLQEQINEYDFNHHNNLIKNIELYNKQEIEYSYKIFKKIDILGMTIYNGIKLKEVIEKMRINTIIINNPHEISRSTLISLFHSSVKNIFYLFSNY